MEEKWKKIYIEGVKTFYSVSNYGNVRNDTNRNILSGSIANNGYRMVHLRGNIDKVCSVHRLVAKAFMPCEMMDDLQINHRDGDKDNNSLSNLEWATPLANMRHSFENSLQPFPDERCYMYDLEGNFIAEFHNALEASRELSLVHSSIRRCMIGEMNRYKDKQFKKFKQEKIPPWTYQNKRAVYVYTRNGEFMKKYESQTECAKDFAVGEASISRYINGTRKHPEYVFSRHPI